MRGTILYSAILVVMAWHTAPAQPDRIVFEQCLIECPPGGISEQEACGEDVNGGCDMEPGAEYFEPIQCDTTICGTAWADGGLRDTDWYVLTVIESGTLNISGEAEFPFELAIAVPGSPDPCVGFAVVAIGQAAEGEIITLQAPVNPGEVWIRASDSGFDSNPCGGDNDDYYVTIDCLPCDDFIIIEIQTDLYPSETSWELIERESGTVVSSAGPLSDPDMLHTWEVCADRTLCYDWYIYDTFGDGLGCYYSDCGYYNVYGFDGELLCSGGEFVHVEACLNIGNCLPQACCIGFECIDVGREECIEIGGRWFQSESCDSFECPPDPCSDAVWQNGFPYSAYYVYSSQCDPVEPSRAALADDFILTGESPVEITGITAWFSHWDADPRATPADYDGVTVTIYNDAGGEPGGYPLDNDPNCGVGGEFVFQQYFLPGTFDYLEEFRNVWRLQFEISDLTLNPGTTYWLSIRPVLTEDPFGRCGNTLTNQQTGSRPVYFSYTSEWRFDGLLYNDLSFCIAGMPLYICDYVIGDFNGNEIFNVADIISAFSKLKTGAPDASLLCECPYGSGDIWAVAMDLNNSCSFNVADVIAGFSKLQTGAPELVPCEACPPGGR